MLRLGRFSESTATVVAGQAHPDWDEYRQAMIDEGRLIAVFTPAKAVGQTH